MKCWLRMHTIRSCFVAAALGLLLGAGSVSAAEIEPFSQAAFEKAQADGQSIMLDFHANWCPTCRVQAKVIKKLISEDQFTDMRFFVVNYDTETKAKEKLGIAKQSTLVVFRGTEEVGRRTGIVDEDQIRNLLKKGL